MRLSQAALAAKLGMNLRSIVRMENGHSPILKVTELAIERLLSLDEPLNPGLGNGEFL